MRRLKEMSRLRLFSILGSILFAIWFLYYFISPLGYFAVISACEKVGGLRVSERIKADGYLHLGHDWGIGVLTRDCLHCAEQVAQQIFTFVDFELPMRKAGEPERFVQYRLMPDTSEKCVAGASYAKPPVGMCVAVVPLDRQPNDKYLYRSEVLTTNWRGVDLRERRRTLVNSSSGGIVSQERHFSFATPWERAGAFSPSYRCDHANHDPAFESEFFSAAVELPASTNAKY